MYLNTEQRERTLNSYTKIYKVTLGLWIHYFLYVRIYAIMYSAPHEPPSPYQKDPMCLFY